MATAQKMTLTVAGNGRVAVARAIPLAAGLQKQGIAQVKADTIQTVPGPSGYSTAAKPTPAGASVIIRKNVGGSDYAAALQRGADQRTKLAEAGARHLPESARAKYIARLVAPFQPPTAPGVVAAIEGRTDAARMTSTAAARLAAANVKAKESSTRLATILAQLNRVQDEADAAAKEATFAARTNQPGRARAAWAKGKNAHAKAVGLARQAVKTGADVQRAGITAGAISSLKDKPTQAGIDVLDTFNSTRGSIQIPASINEEVAPSIPMDELEYAPASVQGGWAYGNRGLGMGHFGDGDAVGIPSDLAAQAAAAARRCAASVKTSPPP
jgi:hypothetical protein